MQKLQDTELQPLARELLHIWGAIFWSRRWQPTPVFSPEKFHGQRGLVDYSPWGYKESDMNEQLSMHRIPYTDNVGDKQQLLVSQFPFAYQRLCLMHRNFVWHGKPSSREDCARLYVAWGANILWEKISNIHLLMHLNTVHHQLEAKGNDRTLSHRGMMQKQVSWSEPVLHPLYTSELMPIHNTLSQAMHLKRAS